MAARSQARRREDPATRRDQILEAAKRCFRSLGFQASSVDRIAAEAGVSVGLLYRFFRSKSAMIEAIVVEAVEAQLSGFGMLIEATPGSAVSIADLVKRALALTPPDRGDLALMLEIAAEISRNAQLRSFLHDRRNLLREPLAQKLMAKGLDRAGAGRVLDGIELASAVSSGLALHAMMSSDSSLERLLAQMGELLDAGLLRDDA